MKRRIVGFRQDRAQQWVALLQCGHDQVLRHNPPVVNQPWVVTPDGRKSMLGKYLNCRGCDAKISDSNV